MKVDKQIHKILGYSRKEVLTTIRALEILAQIELFPLFKFG